MKPLLLFISFVLCFILSNLAFADLEGSELKDLNLLTPEYWDLDPTHGFPLVEGGGLENMSFAVEVKLEKLVTMISVLFHRVNQDEFNPSTVGHTGVRALHPRLIGKILGMVKKFELSRKKGAFSNKLKASQTKVLWDAFYEDERVKVKIAEMRAQTCAYLEASESGGISAEEKEAYIKKSSFFSPDSPFKPTCVTDDSLVPDALMRSFKSMTKAFWEESLGPYPTFVFLSLLWKKLEKREDVLEYYLGLQEGFSGLEAANTMFSPESLELLKSYKAMLATGEEDSELEVWLNAAYSEGDFLERPAKENYADSLFWLTINAKDTFHLEYQKWAFPFRDLPRFSFPDCGATLVKNFFKIFLDTHQISREGLPKEKDYDARILKELGAREEVVHFFEDSFPTRSLQKAQEARDEWGRITCDRDGVEYVTPPPIPGHKCEIAPGQDNMLRFLNSTLFQSEGQKAATSWEELGQKIQAARVKVWGEGQGDLSFGEWRGDKESNRFGRRTLLVQGFSAGFDLVFQEGHFFIAANPKGKLSFDALLDVMGKTDSEGIKALNLYSFLPWSERKLDELFRIDGGSTSHFVKYFIKFSAHNGSLESYTKAFAANLRLSPDQYYKLYQHMKEKRIGENFDLLRRVFNAVYLDYPDLFREGLEKTKDFRVFPHREFGWIYQSFLEGKAYKDAMSTKISALKGLLSFSFKKVDPFVDLKKGLLFFRPLKIQRDQPAEFEVSPDGRYFASWIEGLPAFVYDLKLNRSSSLEMNTRRSVIQSLQFSSDSNRFRSFLEGFSNSRYSYSLIIKSWDLESGDFSTLEEEDERSIPFSHPSGYMKKSPVEGELSGYVLSFDEDSFLRIYEAEPDWSKVKLVRTLGNFTERNNRFFWDWQKGDENEILISFLKRNSVDPEGSAVSLLSMMKNPENKEVEIKQKFNIKINGLGQYLALSPQGNFVLLGITDYKEEEGNSSEGKALLISLKEERHQVVLQGSNFPLEGLSFTPDGTMAVSWDEIQNVYFWSVPEGKLLYTLSHPTFDKIRNLKLTPDGKYLITQMQSFIKVWNLCELNPELFYKSCPEAGEETNSHGGGGAGGGGPEIE